MGRYDKLHKQWANKATRTSETVDERAKPFETLAGTGPPAGTGIEKTPEERKQLLAHAVQREVSKGTGHVESQSDFYATLVRGHRPSHLLHLILSIITLGLWLIVWILVSVFSGEKRTMVSVDDYGNVATRRI